MDGLEAGKLLALICDRTSLSREKIGRIDVKGAYSFFEVDKSYTDKVREHLHGFDYKGRIVRIEVTDARDSGPSRRSGSSSGARTGYQGRTDNQRSKGGRDRDHKPKRW
jgi:ATP-dependent RNA helicase DeaD